MNQANVEKLVSKLKHKVNQKPRKLKNVLGPEGRIKKIQKTLTAIVKYERLEMNYHRADETRGYVERVRITNIFIFTFRYIVFYKTLPFIVDIRSNTSWI